MTNYQVQPGFYIAGNPAGTVIELDPNEQSTLDLISDSAISETIDPKLDPTRETNPSAFYWAIRDSSEFAALDSWTIANPTATESVLLDRTLTAGLEAKAYAEKFGGNQTDLANLEARISQFINALDSATDYGGTGKAAIVSRLETEIVNADLFISVS